MAPNIQLLSSLSDSPVEPTYGTTIPWEDVCYFVSTNQIKRLHRDEKVQKQYNQWMTDVLHAYGTIENYLLLNKLHFTLTTSKDRPPVILLPNDFPYNVASDIKHILIWSLQPLNRDYIEDILNINYGSHLYEWVYFVNPPEIQSVRKLPHVHVFIRPLK